MDKEDKITQNTEYKVYEGADEDSCHDNIYTIPLKEVKKMLREGVPPEIYYITKNIRFWASDGNLELDREIVMFSRDANTKVGVIWET